MDEAVRLQRSSEVSAMINATALAPHVLRALADRFWFQPYTPGPRVPGVYTWDIANIVFHHAADRARFEQRWGKHDGPFQVVYGVHDDRHYVFTSTHANLVTAEFIQLWGASYESDVVPSAILIKTVGMDPGASDPLRERGYFHYLAWCDVGPDVYLDDWRRFFESRSAQIRTVADGVLEAERQQLAAAQTRFDAAQDARIETGAALESALGERRMMMAWMYEENKVRQFGDVMIRASAFDEYPDGSVQPIFSGELQNLINSFVLTGDARHVAGPAP